MLTLCPVFNRPVSKLETAASRLNAVAQMGISPCIPSRIGWKALMLRDASLYGLCHQFENMSARV